MNIHLTSHAATIVQRHLSSGEFTSPEDLIEHALDLLDSQPTLESLKAKIQAGLDDVAVGNVALLEVEDIKRRGRARLEATTKPAQ